MFYFCALSEGYKQAVGCCSQCGAKLKMFCHFDIQYHCFTVYCLWYNMGEGSSLRLAAAHKKERKLGCVMM